MIRLLPFLLFALLPSVLHGEITVRIFSRTRPATVFLTPHNGRCSILIAPGDSVVADTTDIVVFAKYEDRIVVRTRGGVSVSSDSVICRPLSAGTRFALRAAARKEPAKVIKGMLKIKSYPGSLLVLNVTDIEDYLPGVVRSEAGSKGPDEYFKTQAVIARTYAYRHMDRHALDGFNLCDDTHCQVYPGVITEDHIADACRQTRDKVLTGKDSILIISAFHANCGGQTASSADVWVTAQPYLVSLRDPYCLSTDTAGWMKTIPLSEWHEFMQKKGMPPAYDSLITTDSNTFLTRKGNFGAGDKTVSNEDIRNGFGLRSSFFTFAAIGDSIVFKGRGYGHGVGLCQDGAKIMAVKGKKYYEITGFYYPGTIMTEIKNARRPEMP